MQACHKNINKISNVEPEGENINGLDLQSV